MVSGDAISATKAREIQHLGRHQPVSVTLPKGATVPTLDDVYRKFGEVSEAAQLVETELGTMLLLFGVVDEGLIAPTLEVDGKGATELLGRINRQTLGQLIGNTKRHTEALDQLEPLLSTALEERNRLSHQFYRQHNFRRNSDEGRSLMLDDLESIHTTLIEALKALNLLSGIDLDALVDAGVALAPTSHVPI
jgi:hypothetical protein